MARRWAAGALTTIVAELNAVNEILWVITIYILASTVMLPIGGTLGDLIGRKQLFSIAAFGGWYFVAVRQGDPTDIQHRSPAAAARARRRAGGRGCTGTEGGGLARVKGSCLHKRTVFYHRPFRQSPSLSDAETGCPEKLTPMPLAGVNV